MALRSKLPLPVQRAVIVGKSGVRGRQLYNVLHSGFGQHKTVNQKRSPVEQPTSEKQGNSLTNDFPLLKFEIRFLDYDRMKACYQCPLKSSARTLLVNGHIENVIGQLGTAGDCNVSSSLLVDRGSSPL